MASRVLSDSTILEERERIVSYQRGQVSSHSTGNKPINTVAGGNVTTINYYGSDYSNAWNPTKQEMDPAQFTKPVADLASLVGPALKAPDREEQGYSDRLMQLVAGSSCITTQEAANAVVAYGRWPEYESTTGEHIDLETRPGPACDRFYTFDSVQWTTTSNKWTLPLPGSLKDVGVFGQNCQFNFLMRSGFVVHVQVNASKFHEGMLLVAMVPECVRNPPGQAGHSQIYDGLVEDGSSWKNLPTNQLTVFPHQFINLRTNNSATIVYPYINCYPSEFSMIHNYVTVVIAVISPLRYNTGASTAIPITVSVAPQCSEFSGLRNPFNRPTVAPSAQGVPIRAVPGHEQFCTVQRDNGIPSYPDFVPVKGVSIPGEVTNFIAVARVPTIIKANAGDNYSISTMAIAVNQGVNTSPIFTWDMSLLAPQFQTTYVARLARLYTQYHGSLKLDFVFTGSAMATGKFLIAYTPPGGDAPPTRQAAMLATHVIWDVGLQSTVSFTIPYISTSHYRFNNVSGNALSYCGYLTMWYQTAIVVPPGAPTTCDIVGFLSAGEDFVFRVPSDSAYFQGFGDTVKGIVNGAVARELEKVDVVMTHTNATEAAEVSVGDAAVLNAIETGASDESVGKQMETKAPTLAFSARETDLEYLLSRYTQLGFVTTTNGLPNSNFVLPLGFQSVGGTAMGRAIYSMCTYWKFDLDVVVMIERRNVQNATAPIRYRWMYVPPGGRVPTTGNFDSDIDQNWAVMCQPVVYGEVDGAPTTLRLPYLSPASAYSTWYDGYSRFDLNRTSYDSNPGNDIGQLAFQIFTRQESADSPVFRFRIFVRPVNIKGWLPRPIVTRVSEFDTGNMTTRLDVERVVYVKRGPISGQNKWQDGLKYLTRADRARMGMCVSVFHCDTNMPWGAMYIGNARFVTVKHTQWKVDDEVLLHTTELNEDGRMVQTVPTRARVVAKWFHPTTDLACYQMTLDVPAQDDDMEIDLPENDEEMEVETLYTTRRVSRMVDIIQSTDEDYFDSTFENVMDRDEFSHDHVMDVWEMPSEAVLYINTAAFPCYAKKVSLIFEEPVVRTANSEGVETIVDTNFTAAVCTDLGWCGSLLMKGNVVVGMLHAGLGTDLSNFVQISRQVIEEIFCEEEQEMETGFYVPSEQRGIAKIATRILGIDEVCREARDEALRVGEEVMDDFLSKVTSEINQVTQKLQSDMEQSIYVSVLKLTVKIVSGFVMIVNSEDKVLSMMALSSLLGADLISAGPFEWMKQQVLKLLGCNVEKQGPIDWIKDFNAACTAAKGLDWIWKMLSQFWSWLSQFWEKEKPRRQRFHEQVLRLPVLMADIDRIERARSLYTDESVKQICEEILELKELAAIYGVERNFATGQIIKLAAKANKILTNMSSGRHEPVAMLIHGRPGTGKSLITDVVGRVLSLAYDKQKPYSLPPDPDHFDGYTRQAVVLMDDLGQNPDGKDVSTFCQMVSSTDFIPPMASLEEKGVQFTSKFVLASTNCEVLSPPTIMEPEALQRRFFLDLDIEVQQEYKVRGRLDAPAALQQNNSDLAVFKKSCPLLDGSAVRLKCRRTLVTYTVDEVAQILISEQKKRESCFDAIDALFQGPKVEEKVRFQTYLVEKGRVVTEKPLPSEYQVLFEYAPKESLQTLVEMFEKEGYIVPMNTQLQIVREQTSQMASWISVTIGAISALVAFSTVFALCYRLYSNKQGAYSGAAKTTLKPPERRVVQVQGPNLEFVTKLFKHSVSPVVTSQGPFTGLGLFDKWMLLPRHACPSGKIMFKGNPVEVEDVVELVGVGDLELVAVKLKMNEPFKDIRPYLPDVLQNHDDAFLAMNSDSFPRMVMPVGDVSVFGTLNLEMNLVHNTLMYNVPTKVGQCGGVVCKAGKIIGMHIGGDGKNGYAAGLKKSYFVQLQGVKKNEQRMPEKVHVKTVTQLYPSVFYDVFPGEKEPAVLSKFDKRLDPGVDFDEVCFSKYKANVDLEPSEIHDVVVDQYVEQLRPLMPSDLCEELSLEDVVYGIEHLEGLDLNTSAGYPYNVKGIRKRDLIPVRGEPLTRLQEALDLHGYDLPFTTYVKDELRKPEKVRAGKTRLIECASVNDTILMKRKFGRLFATMHKNPGVVTGSAVGCNPEVDWSKFAVMLGEEHICAFDYTNFDGSLSPIWFKMLKKVLGKLGYKQDALVLIDRMCNSKHVWRDLYYEVDGGMPSGISGTSIFNSMINNLIVKTLVLEQYKGINLNELKILAYGDDLLISYPYDLDPGVLAEAGKRYQLTMTPADKRSEFNGASKLSEVTFLKRRFVPDEKFPFLIHPVYPMEEIYESIRWCRGPNTQEHVRSLCELAWHNGRDVYDQFLEQVRSVPVGAMLSLPSYDMLCFGWYDNF